MLVTDMLQHLLWVQETSFEDCSSHGTARLGVLCKLRVRYSVALAARPFFNIVEVHDLSFTTVSILNCNSIISNFSRLTSA